jgi:lipoate-protein ligase B
MPLTQLPECIFYRLGLIDYQAAWDLQERLAVEIAAGRHPLALLLLEHPHTYTFGRRGHAENLLWDAAELERRGAAVHWVDRGGDVTYHGPGQLVGYPLLPLAPGGLYAKREPGTETGDSSSGSMNLPKADYVGYVRRLEETLIVALLNLGLAAAQVAGMTGVWVQPDVISRCNRQTTSAACAPVLHQPPAKIAAIGVKVDVRGVSRHGFALNVDPDMSYWDGIVACGLEGYPLTSLAELLQPAPAMERVIEAVMAAFGEVFGYRMVERTLD